MAARLAVATSVMLLWPAMASAAPEELEAPPPAPAESTPAAIATEPEPEVVTTPETAEPVEPAQTWVEPCPDEPEIPTTALAPPEPPPPPAPLHDKPSTSGVFFGDTVTVGPMGRHVGVWNEMHMSFQLLPRLTIGTGLNFFVGPDQRLRAPNGGPRLLHALYGGIRGGVALVHRKRVDVGIDGYVGGGRMCLDSLPDDDGDSHCIEHTGIFVTEPRVYVNVKVLDFMRLGLAGGYRFVTRRKIGPADRVQLSGAFVAAVIEFGVWN